jgi:drug/metabolite transporter (DMT)-like permease
MDSDCTRHRHHGRGLVAMGIFLAAGAGLAMLLWNALLPHLFAVPAVTYLQALGLMVLTRLLLGRGMRPWGAHGVATCRTRGDVGTDPTEQATS